MIRLFLLICLGLCLHFRPALAQNQLNLEAFTSSTLSNGSESRPAQQWLDSLPAQSVVFFWATWCKPCIMEMEAVYEGIQEGKIKADNVYFISYEPLEKMEAFMQKRKMQELKILKTSAGLQALGILSIPYAVVFDTKGAVIHTETGFYSKAHTFKFVKKYTN